MKKKLKVLVLCDAIERASLGQSIDAYLASDRPAEADVLAALKELGWAADTAIIFDDFEPLREKLRTFRPDIIFNLADQFRNNRAFDQHIAAFLEMHGLSFTGCGAAGLALGKHKAIAKKLVSHHGIRVPASTIIPRGSADARPSWLRFPILIKPLKEDASYGISQDSFVQNDRQYQRRVRFIHEQYDNDVIAEEYIEGRELYVSLLGDRRLHVLPIRELVFGGVRRGQPRIASYNSKWNEAYRQRHGLRNQFAEGLSDLVVRKIQQTCRCIFRALELDGYARIDLRLTPTNEVYFIEANPNPAIAADEDFAQSARQAGLRYSQLVERIVRIGLRTARA